MKLSRIVNAEDEEIQPSSSCPHPPPPLATRVGAEMIAMHPSIFNAAGASISTLPHSQGPSQARVPDAVNYVSYHPAIRTEYLASILPSTSLPTSESANVPSSSFCSNEVLTAPNPGAVPPTLPPSVEQAYRRKCIQLKQRMNEVEEANDISRTRLSRMHRGIEKLRLERAFLIEQLEKRTSTNVEDSEGSPSPPPTPNEKPLRTKRGHRKPSFLANLDSAPSFVSQGLGGGAATLSPSGSDAFSMTHPEAVPSVRASNANRQLAGMGNGYLPTTTIDPLSKPKSAFDVYCRDLRDVLIVQNRKAFNEGNWDPDRALAQGWRDMDEGRRGEFQTRYEEMRKAEKEAVKGDEDVEMGDGGDETEVAEETGGFTAVNQ